MPLKTIKSGAVKNLKKANALFSRRYSTSITKKVPPKRLKHPCEIFKSKSHRQVIKKIYNYFYDLSHEGYRQREFISRQKIIAKRIDFVARKYFKVKDVKNFDQHLHFLFPLTGMSTVGYFYKGFLEQMYPKARFTFLVTPKVRSSKLHFLNIDNLKKHLMSSLNINDRCVIMIDYMSYNRRTEQNIVSAFEKIFNTNANFIFSDFSVYSFNHNNSNTAFFSVNSPEISHYMAGPDKPFSELNYYKEKEYDKSKEESGKRVVSRHISAKSKKEIENIKKLEKVIKYTFYYIGNKFAKNNHNYRMEYLMDEIEYLNKKYF